MGSRQRGSRQTLLAAAADKVESDDKVEAKLARKGLVVVDELGYETEGSKGPTAVDEVTDDVVVRVFMSSWLCFLLVVWLLSVTRISTDDDLDLSCLGEALVVSFVSFLLPFFVVPLVIGSAPI